MNIMPWSLIAFCLGISICQKKQVGNYVVAMTHLLGTKLLACPLTALTFKLNWKILAASSQIAEPLNGKHSPKVQYQPNKILLGPRIHFARDLRYNLYFLLQQFWKSSFFIFRCFCEEKWSFILLRALLEIVEVIWACYLEKVCFHFLTGYHSSFFGDSHLSKWTRTLCCQLCHDCRSCT